MTPEQQKACFESFGFLFVRQGFAKDEMDEIALEADRLWQEDRGARPLGPEGQHVMPFVELSSLLTGLVGEDRLFGVIENLLGPGFLWGGSEGNVTVRGTHQWHPDRPGDEAEVSYTRLKVNMYLDAVGIENGCLRVIPGSHRTPLHEEIEPDHRHQRDDTVAPFGVAGPDMPSVALESQPGDLCFFNQSLWHAVFNGWAGRRYIALRFAARPKTDKQIASFRHYSPPALFEPAESLLTSENPRIRGMVEPLRAIGAKAVAEFVPFR